MKYFLAWAFILSFSIAFSQLGRGKNTSVQIISDTTKSSLTKIDTLSKNDTVDLKDDSDIKDKITYQAEDSIVYDLNSKKMYLYNGGSMKYEKIDLQADAVELDWSTFTLTAQGVKDSLGNMQGTPVFKDDGKDYLASKMQYNFKTKKGKVFEVMTKEGEAFLHSESVKKGENNDWYGYKSKFTTCELEHPHFYFKAKKIKMVPNKVMVTGPANLWIGDVPTPLYIPFGIFPVKQGRRSGIVVPKWGTSAGTTAGGGSSFGLKEGGYYWAINDNMSLKVLGDIYTNGTFGVRTDYRFVKLYKFTGNFGFNYIRTAPIDPDLPKASAGNNFVINVGLQMSPNAAPTHSFSASINIVTNKYNKAENYNTQQIVNTSFNSAINYGKTFSRVSWLNLSLGANHNQNIASRTFTITLPVFRANVSRVTPFKKKISNGKPKFYENIGLSYSFEAKAQLNTYDSLLSKQSTWQKDLHYGMLQTLKIDAPFTLFKYLNVNPSFNYNERWYFEQTKRTWVTQDAVIRSPTGAVISVPLAASYAQLDTIHRFNAVRDFNANINFSTKMIGIYNFKGKYLKAFRHIFTPTISANYQPDFSASHWGYYDSVRTSFNNNDKLMYAFANNSSSALGYGMPSAGMVGAVRFNLGNVFDMKTYSKLDTIKHEKKSAFMLERINVSGGYNFAAKQYKVENLVVAGSLRFMNNLSGSFNLNFDPYSLDSLGKRIPVFEFAKTGHLMRFNTGSFALNGNISSKNKSGNSAPPKTTNAFQKNDYINMNPDAPYDFSIPWAFNASYNFQIASSKSQYTGNDTLLIRQALGFGGNFSLTRNWNFNVQSGYDIRAKDLTYTTVGVTRLLHCWQISFNWTAYPIRNQQFMIELRPVAGMLQDLKIPHRRNTQIYPF